MTPRATSAWPRRCPPRPFPPSWWPSIDSATFTATSAPGAGGAEIVSRVWQFGDPASGAGNTARTRRVAHTFSAPGVYEVSLTITDANGLTATVTHPVTAPGPPTVAFTAARVGTSETFVFHDASQPGIGGAAVVQWVWRFGNPGSPSNASGLQNPQHTFTAPGTYRVCLIVIDANNRGAGVCHPVVVPAVSAQASKRTVASTALSSPIS